MTNESELGPRYLERLKNNQRRGVVVHDNSPQNVRNEGFPSQEATKASEELRKFWHTKVITSN